MKDAVKEAIKAFFEGDDNIRLAFLFGSMARGLTVPTAMRTWRFFLPRPLLSSNW